jgi:undecaprenyl diphosphate synthase
LESYSLTNKEQTKADRLKQKEISECGPIPEHIAIIMDGNGRWAKGKGNVRVYGHKAGVDSVRDITEACAQLGVKYLTLYAFSTENWGRPSNEVNALIKLLVHTLRTEADKLHENNIKLSTIGQIERFPNSCQEELLDAIQLTKDNDRMQLCLALSYSGRWDITEAVRKMGEKIKNGELDPEDIDDKLIEEHLSTARIPDPDLIIRTSGEYRLSNFLLWQLAYSELFITDTFWPEFRRDELYQAILSFQLRERRYGKIDKGHTGSFTNNIMNHITS